MMRRALHLGRRGWGKVAPNPLVGAVVARGDRIVGEGHHAAFGGEHAEVVALRKAGERATGATLYAALEPCDHWGKTPPCTEAIRQAGIRRVVYACRDPDSRSGHGADRLREAGLEVVGGVGARAAARLNAPFLWRHTEAGQRAPFVAVKLALSLDARIAAAARTRSEVTGQAAWAAVHRLRAGYEAVMIGSGTLGADDPLLTPRGRRRARRPPVRVVLDSALRHVPDSRLAGSVGEGPVWAFAARGVEGSSRARLEEAGLRVYEVPAAPEEGVELGSVLEHLAREGVGSILVEGGGRLATALLRGGHVHRLYLILAPLLYGPRGIEAFPGAEPSARGSWEVVGRRALSQDTLLVLDRASLMRELGVG